jgi:hypothetical protein
MDNIDVAFLGLLEQNDGGVLHTVGCNIYFSLGLSVYLFIFSHVPHSPAFQLCTHRRKHPLQLYGL